MTQARPERPLLATIICVYLVVTIVVPLPVALIYLHGLLHSVFAYHSMLPHSAVSWVNCVLAIAGAVALWQMQRSAFYLLATRFGLSLIMFFLRLRHAVAFFQSLPPAINGSVAMMGTYAAIMAQWILGALIVWYVYKITSPKVLPPPLSEPEAVA